MTVGDIADAMLDGDLCQCCGVYMEGGNGYPQLPVSRTAVLVVLLVVRQSPT